METNGCAAVPGDDGRLTFYASTQMPHGLQPISSPGRWRWTRADVHVRHARRSAAASAARPASARSTPPSPAAARQLGRPVTWIADPQRGPRVACPTAAARSSTPSSAAAPTARSPACASGSSATPAPTRASARSCPAGTKRMSNGTYRSPPSSSTSPWPSRTPRPMGAYRGAGRPEATALLERLVDQAAHELGIDPIELRRRNLLGRRRLPVHAPLTGVTYDSGDYTTAARRRRRGHRLRGAARGAGRAARAGATGCSSASASPPTSRSPPAAAASEFGARRGPRRRLGHRARRHVVARPGPPDGVRHARQRPDRHPDRARSPSSTATPTSCPAAGAPAARARCSSAGRRCTRRPRRWSSGPSAWPPDLLEADAADIVVDTDAGTVGVAGVPAAALSWAELATRPRGARPRSSATARRPGCSPPSSSTRATPRSRSAAHIAVVEVDLDTGGRAHAPRRRRRLRHGDQPAARRGPAARRRRVRASARRCTRRSATTTTATRSPSNLADYGIPTAAELPSFEVPSTADADAAQPARRQGHRRGRHDRLDPGRAERRDRRARPPRRPPPRHAVHARAGVARRSATPRPARCPIRGASRRPCSPRCAPAQADDDEGLDAAEGI